MVSASCLVSWTAWFSEGLVGASVGRSAPSCFWMGCWPEEGSPVVGWEGIVSSVGFVNVVLAGVGVLSSGAEASV